jgi:rRNA maturation RNase YbeY
MKIGFNDAIRTPLKNRKALKSFLNLLAKSEKQDFGELNYIFCSDEELLEINKRFLKHNYYTDIITFNLSPINNNLIIGEIYISIDRIRENAKTYNTSVAMELHRVIFHGILHLCGYNDKTSDQKSKMTQKENQYLKKYFRN